jgi:hypothetical protein
VWALAGCRGRRLALRCPRNVSERSRTVLKRILLIFVGVVVFVAISAALARFFSAENVERDDELALVEAQAKGDVNGMLKQLSDCRKRPSCLKAVQTNAADSRLRRSGAVKILDLTSPTAHSLTGASGTTRLAWTVIGKLPIVQCIGVRRTGNALSGIKIALLSVSGPIPNEGDC